MPPPRPTNYDRQQDQQNQQANQQQDQQNQQANQQQNQQIQNLQNRLTGVETNVVEQGAQASTLQRLRIHIPNPYTHFLLGQRSPTNPTFGYNGVSLQTDENFFFDIKKQSVFQSEKFVLFQTKDIWQQVAQKLMELSSPTAVKVVGGQVFVGAIESPKAPVFNPNNGETLQAVAPNNLQPLMEQVLKSAGTWDTVASILGILHSSVFLSTPDPNLNSWLPFLESLYGIGKDAFGLLPDSGGAAPSKDVSIYGQSGVSVLTPANLMFVAEGDMKTFAGGDTGITSKSYSTLQAGIGAKCFGGFKASVEAGLYAEVKAASTVGIASLRGTAEVKGKVIALGAHAPNLAQVATQKIELKATQEIDVDSMQKVHLKSGEKTHIEADTDIEVKAKDAARIHVGDYCIEIKPDGIKIGKGSNGTPSDPIITIAGEEIAISSSGMGTKITKSRVFIGKAGTNMTVSDSGNVFVKGSVIKLG
ncbi:hypothetical protein [Hyalangium sp.]|uniref:hypothetical protein n=1 Tax=Hyalangium sp. TaxID=2028555 RepID=UPI002D6F6958|nr:hypothetical protein [Hyalangium sp.]HYH94568.1 hypothetical protein [Hyalangium sp.]